MARTLSTAVLSLLLASLLLLWIQAVMVVAEDTSFTSAAAASRLNRRMVPKCVMDCNKDIQERCLDKTPNPCGEDEVPGEFCVNRCSCQLNCRVRYTNANTDTSCHGADCSNDYRNCLAHC